MTNALIYRYHKAREGEAGMNSSNEIKEWFQSRTNRLIETVDIDMNGNVYKSDKEIFKFPVPGCRYYSLDHFEAIY